MSVRGAKRSRVWWGALLVAFTLLSSGAAPVLASDRMAPVEVNGRLYDAYIETANKPSQFFYYTCEFDAAWTILRTYGYDVPLDQQLEIVGLDRSIEPYAVQQGDTFIIYGGDIESAFSGDYTSNFLARTTGHAMAKLFEHFDLTVRPVENQQDIETALDAGELVWTKATVDFLPWQEATWVTPDGDTFKTVLGNDHAVVIIGYNTDAVVIRDALGPTNTNWNRAFEYEVPWDTFLAVFAAQNHDGLAVTPPGAPPAPSIPISAMPVNSSQN